MNILITAGGTREDIDSVRGIANYSTGQLGSQIANRFIQGGNKVTYICGEGAVFPDPNPCLKVTIIRNVTQLQEKLEQALYSTQYDCVIHSMAVSDYSPYGIASVDELDVQLKDLKLTKPPSEKISSDSSFLVVVLKRQPKIIQRIKEIQPDTILIGFKLLSDGSEEELMQAAYKLMGQSQADYVLANDLKNIYGDYHKATLLSQDGVVGSGSSKKEIAQMIYDIMQKYKTTKRYRDGIRGQV